MSETLAGAALPEGEPVRLVDINFNGDLIGAIMPSTVKPTRRRLAIPVLVNTHDGFARVTAARLRMARHAQTQAAINARRRRHTTASHR
jgi:hypothetical protein